MKLKHYWPLVSFLVPVLAGSALMWPLWASGPMVVGGFAVMLLGMVVTYAMGIRLALRDATHAAPDPD